MKRILSFSVVFVFSQVCAAPSLSPELRGIVEVSRTYRVKGNIPYRRNLNVDISMPRPEGPPLPVLVYFHGGGWISSNKEGATLHVLPFLAKGWISVNVAYRLGTEALAPAAVEDCLCALNWIKTNASKYRMDPEKVVIMGHSAGGHLALISAFLPENSKINKCPGAMPHIVGVVNFFGITDVPDLLEKPNEKEYALKWIGKRNDAKQIAKSVSPMNYIRAGLPPVITVHGNKDESVPYSHAVKLHEALSAVNVRNKLITIPEGKHGGFSSKDYGDAYAEIFQFLGISD